MQRVDARCNVHLPVRVWKVNGEPSVERSASFSVISLNGALIDFKQPSFEQQVIGLRYKLPKHGEFDMLGKVIRKEKDGLAVQFYNVNRDTKIKLWDYIKENIQESNVCPYCSGENEQKVSKCRVCGWNLNFHSPDYLVHHEKESFINRLNARSTALTIEDICKIINFIDVEVLGIGKSWDINEEFVGSSHGMLEVFSKIRKISPSDMPVLMTGEQGTGKELTARAIYERSSRKGKPFVHISCSAIPENLQEVELFGDENKIGKLEYADGGTVFLNDIDALSRSLQQKLLKFIDNQIVIKTGAKVGKKVHVRMITATSTDLHPAVLKEGFLKKLHSFFQIHLQPVRERGNDKVILARYFLNKFSRELNVSKTLSNGALAAIKNYDWPGNVREIINKVRMAVLMSSSPDIKPSDLNLETAEVDLSSITSLRDAKSIVEKKKLVEVLRFCNNNISKTARILGISRPSVYSLKKKYGI
jgi:transcriptional regulator of acetoin/glycerol metabolism